VTNCLHRVMVVQYRGRTAGQPQTNIVENYLRRCLVNLWQLYRRSQRAGGRGRDRERVGSLAVASWSSAASGRSS